MMANIYFEGYLEVLWWLTFWSADTKTRQMLYKSEGKKGCAHLVAVLSNWTFHSKVRFWLGRGYWEGCFWFSSRQGASWAPAQVS